MIGAKGKPILNTKAAGARGLLEFVVKMLEECLPDLAGTDFYDRCQLLLACAGSALDVDHLLRSNGMATMTNDARQLLFQKYTHHVHLYVMCGGILMPKHHMMYRLIHKCGVYGHPSLWATFRDESLNGVIAKIARSCHRRTFNKMIHIKLKRLQRLGGKCAMMVS